MGKSAASTVGSQLSGREAGLFERGSAEEKPKLLKPIRKSISNSELMLDQIKKMAYAEADTYNYWIKEIEESEELQKQYMDLFGIADAGSQLTMDAGAAQKAYQLEMTQERPNLHGSMLVRLMLNAFRKSEIDAKIVSAETKITDQPAEELDNPDAASIERNKKKDFMKKLNKLSLVLKELRNEKDLKEEEDRLAILKRV